MRTKSVLVGLAGLASVAVAGVLAWAPWTSGRLAVKELIAGYPLASIRVMQHGGVTDEIFATLAPGVRLDEAVSLNLFAGFEPHMTVEAARQRLGPPTGEWDDPFCRRRAPFYERRAGKVSLCRYQTEAGGHTWDTVGYPLQCDPEWLFRDQGLWQQLKPWVPETEGVGLHVTSQVGSGSVTVNMARTGCAWVVLSQVE